MSEIDVLLDGIEKQNEIMEHMLRDLRSMLSSKPKEETKKIEFTDLRALCAEKSRLGFTKKIRELILSLNAEKLSEVDPANYTLLYEKVEGLK